MATTAAQQTQTATLPTTSTPKAKTPGLADNFDTFLTLLTTQLKNQTPLDPLDTNQFTQQLVQFASVEQQLKTNDSLSSLLASSKSSTASNIASFIGLNITADGSSATLSANKASWTIEPAKAAAQAAISIRDSSGSVIATETRPLAAGKQVYNWDGRTSTGTLAPDGDYTLSIVARDASGQKVEVKTEITGTVDSVDLSGETPILSVGGSSVPLTKVKNVSRLALN